jgi:hypothetical protein
MIHLLLIRLATWIHSAVKLINASVLIADIALRRLSDDYMISTTKALPTFMDSMSYAHKEAMDKH